MNPLVNGIPAKATGTVQTQLRPAVSAGPIRPSARASRPHRLRPEPDSRRERAHGAESVGQKVEHRRGQAGIRIRNHSGQNESGVRDGRIREHPLHIGLRHSDDRSDNHRENRDRPHQWTPVHVLVGQSHIEDTKDGTECGDLGRSSHETGDRRRRPLIDIGNPRMERHGTDFEQ